MAVLPPLFFYSGMQQERCRWRCTDQWLIPAARRFPWKTDFNSKKRDWVQHVRLSHPLKFVLKLLALTDLLLPASGRAQAVRMLTEIGLLAPSLRRTQAQHADTTRAAGTPYYCFPPSLSHSLAKKPFR